MHDNTAKGGESLETGDYFVVSRGWELEPNYNTSIFSMSGMNEDAYDTPQYSKVFDGLVFESIERCHNFVAAKIIAASYHDQLKFVGAVVSLDLRRIVIETVSKKYALACSKSNVKANESK